MRGRKSLLLILLVLFPFAASPVEADTVILRSGIKYTDVRTEPTGESHRIRFSDGCVVILPNSTIRSLRPGATTWTRPTPPGTQKEKTETRPEPRPPAGTTENSRIPPAHGGTQWLPILQSAVLPGWGQYTLGRKQTGSLYAISSLLVLQQYWSIRQQHASAERDYNDPGPVGAVAAQTATGAMSLPNAAAINLAYLSQKERRVHRLEGQGNAMVFAFALIWGWNMLDIYYGGTPWESRWFRSSAAEVRGVPAIVIQRDSITAVIQVRL